MSTRLSGSLLLLVALVLLFNAGEFAAQDPVPATPAPQATAPDLSGTYAGTFNCDALGLTGDTTLTITGNQFTTADGKTGRIVASKSGGYTAVAFQVGEMNPTTPATTQPSAAPQIVSMRARKSGNRLTLTSAPGSTMKCSFTTGATARGRRQRTPAATGTEVSAPVTAPTYPTTPDANGTSVRADAGPDASAESDAVRRVRNRLRNRVPNQIRVRRQVRPRHRIRVQCQARRRARLQVRGVDRKETICFLRGGDCLITTKR